MMNALEFVLTPHKYLPSDFHFPFTIPATSTIISSTTDVATVTTSAAVMSESLRASTEAIPTYNSSTTLGFFLYAAAHSQRIFLNGTAGGIFFGGPSRSYWMLTIFMVAPYQNGFNFQYILVNRTLTYASVRRPIRLKFGQRLLLRLAPILFLLHCIMRILSSLRCQCPASYPLSWPEPCITSSPNVLWYTFKCICLSYFVDTFCASLEMRTGPGDNGMSVLEYAFAFAETANIAPTPEVLIAALLSVTGTLVSSHIVALFNWQSYRVLPLPYFLIVVDSHNAAWYRYSCILHLYNRLRTLYTTTEYLITLSDSIYHDFGPFMYMHIHLTLCSNAHWSP